MRSNAPIFAADKVIEESGIEFEHEVEDTDEVVEKFKEFLDQVSPDDFLTEGYLKPPQEAVRHPARSAL